MASTAGSSSSAGCPSLEALEGGSSGSLSPQPSPDAGTPREHVAEGEVVDGFAGGAAQRLESAPFMDNPMLAHRKAGQEGKGEAAAQRNADMAKDLGF